MDMQLEPGKTYRFTHIRKGTFVAQLIDVIPSDPGDEADTQLLKVKIDTRKGSGQERLARTNAEVHVTNLRPSLILQCEEVEGDAWLQQRQVKAEEDQAKKQYEADLKHTVETILKQAETHKKPGIMDRLFGRKQNLN